MAKLSKRMRAIRERLQPGRLYPVDAALTLLKEVSSVKFTETVEASVNLGVDPRKSDQVVRGSTLLPNGTGKAVRVAVFAQGEQAQAAAAAGADIVGLEDLAQSMKDGELNYDVIIATPDTMRVVGQLGPLLGPRGLMPNPKVGTVTADAGTAVRNAKAGQVRYRTDKAGIVHCAIGKVSFEVPALQENLRALLADQQKVKPAAAKGTYMKRVTVSTTMGPGLPVDQSTISG
jgi:large subunit ribosomal protein L1